jgi:hypothetical protein
MIATHCVLSEGGIKRKHIPHRFSGALFFFGIVITRVSGMVPTVRKFDDCASDDCPRSRRGIMIARGRAFRGAKMRRLILAGALCAAVGLPVGASAAEVKVSGTGSLSCSKWLKAREANDEVQTSLIVQWIAGFAIAHNYYVGFEQKPQQQLDVKLDDIKSFTDKYCRYNPLTQMLIEVAAEYVQTIGGTVAYPNRSQKKKK